MDQAAALDPCHESIASESGKSRIGSSLMSVSAWPNFKNQFAEMEHIDTHAPLSLRAGMYHTDNSSGVV